MKLLNNQQNLNKENHDLKVELLKKDDQIYSLQRKLEQKENEMNSFISNINNNNNFNNSVSIADLTSLLIQTQKQYEDILNENTRLSKELFEVNKNPNAIYQLKEMIKENNKLNNDNENLKNELNDLKYYKDEYDQLTISFSSYQSKTNNQISELQQKVNNLITENEQLTNNLNENSINDEDLEIKQQAIDKLIDDNKHLEEKYNKIFDENESNKILITKLQHQISNVKPVEVINKPQIDHYENKITLLLNENTKLQQEISKYKIEKIKMNYNSIITYQDMNIINNDYDIDNIMDLIDELNIEVSKCKNEIIEIKEHKEQNDKLEEIISNNENEINKLNNIIENLNNQISLSRNDILNLQNKLKIELNEKERLYSINESQIEELNNMKSNLKDIINSNNKYKDSLEIKENELIEYKKKYNELNNKYKEKNNEIRIKELEDKNNELNNKNYQLLKDIETYKPIYNQLNELKIKNKKCEIEINSIIKLI